MVFLFPFYIFLRRVVPTATLLFLFTLSASGQVNVDSLYKQHNVMAGETYILETTVTNSADVPVEIWIKKSDYIYTNSQHLFPKSGSTERSNSEWIIVPNERLLLPARRKVTLSFTVNVPSDIPPGTYNSILGIELIPTVEGQPVGMRIGRRLAVQVVTDVDVEKAEQKLEISKVEVEGDRLKLTIRNSGEAVITFAILPPVPGIQSNRHARIFPNSDQIIELDISNLADGLYEDLRFLLDDEDTFIKPVRVTFRKGIAPTAIPLHRIEGEPISRPVSREKQRSPWRPRLNAVLTYGNDYRAVSLTGNFTVLKRFSFYGSSNYREFSEYFDDKVLNYRAGVSLNLKGLRLSYSQYWFQDSSFQMVGFNANVKGFSANGTYSIDRKVFQGSVRKNFFKRWSVRVFGYYDFERMRHRVSASLVIPIL